LIGIYLRHPSISEMSDLAMALYVLGKTTILPEDTELLLPLFGKTSKDRNFLLLKDNFKSIVAMAKINADQLVGTGKVLIDAQLEIGDATGQKLLTGGDLQDEAGGVAA
jgi:hypothetical protein